MIKRFITYIRDLLEKRSNILQEQIDCSNIIKEEIAKDEKLKRYINQKKSIRNTIRILIILFFVMANIMVQLSNTIDKENTIKAINVGTIEALTSDLPKVDREKMLQTFSEELKERSRANKTTLAILFCSVSVVLVSIMYRVENSMLHYADEEVMEKYRKLKIISSQARNT